MNHGFEMNQSLLKISLGLWDKWVELMEMKGGFCYGSGKLHCSDFSYIQHTVVKQIMPLQFKVSGHQAFFSVCGPRIRHSAANWHAHPTLVSHNKEMY